MKNVELMKAMNDIDDELLLDAHSARSSRRVWSKGLTAAVVAACLTITAVAAGVAMVKLRTDPETANADVEQQLAEYGDAWMTDLSETERVTGEEKAKASAEWVESLFQRKYDWEYEEYEVLSDETDGPTWTRKLTYDRGWLCTAEDLTTLLKNDGDFAADFSYLEQTAEPVPDALVIGRERQALSQGDNETYQTAYMNATYRTASGGALVIDVYADENLVMRPEVVYAESFTFEDTVTSADGVEFSVYGLENGRIYAYTYCGHMHMHFIGFECTREEVTGAIAHSCVADMVASLSEISS